MVRIGGRANDLRADCFRLWHPQCNGVACSYNKLSRAYCDLGAIDPGYTHRCVNICLTRPQQQRLHRDLTSKAVNRTALNSHRAANLDTMLADLVFHAYMTFLRAALENFIVFWRKL